MNQRKMLEGVATWLVFYLGMLVGGLLMVIVMGCFLHNKSRGR